MPRSSAALPAAALLGRAPDLIMLDVTDPQRPRARPLDAALARIVRGRVVNRVSSPASCAMARVARPSWPRPSTGSPPSRRRRRSGERAL